MTLNLRRFKLDSIHNPKETLWEGIFPEEDTYQIENFLDKDELKFIIDWYHKEKLQQGFYLQKKALQFIGDQHNDPAIKEVW